MNFADKYILLDDFFEYNTSNNSDVILEINKPTTAGVFSLIFDFFTYISGRLTVESDEGTNFFEIYENENLIKTADRVASVSFDMQPRCNYKIYAKRSSGSPTIYQIKGTILPKSNIAIASRSVI